MRSCWRRPRSASALSDSASCAIASFPPTTEAWRSDSSPPPAWSDWYVPRHSREAGLNRARVRSPHGQGGLRRHRAAGLSRARARRAARRLPAGPRGFRALAHRRSGGEARLRVPRRDGSAGRAGGAAIMKYLDEYRDAAAARRLIAAIARTARRPWVLMEVCGGQTHSIVKYGIDELLPPGVELVHGPGCPVCVTSLEMIDRAHAIAARRDVIFCSFGDMLRVPGSRGDLLALKSQGADVRIAYSPLDAVKLAASNPKRAVVFFAIGFETTAPANAMAASLAKKRGLRNFSLLVSHVLTPPAITAILQSPDNRVQAFLGPGHVCTVMGTAEYEPIARHYRVPVIVSGFEPLDLLDAIFRAVRQLEEGRAEVEIAYARAVRPQGNEASRKLIDEVFEVCDRKWRGVGSIPKSGYKLRWEYRDYDAERRFEVEDIETRESPICISGQVLRGIKKPRDCPAFGKQCTPDTPLGATMVSAEGACAAYYAYGRYLPRTERCRQRPSPGAAKRASPCRWRSCARRSTPASPMRGFSPCHGTV